MRGIECLGVRLIPLTLTLSHPGEGTSLRLASMPSRPGGSILLPTSPDFLRLQAERRAAAGGLVFRGRRIAYGELAAAVDGLADWLARRGIGAGGGSA